MDVVMETKTKYIIVVAAIGLGLIAYGFLQNPVDILPDWLQRENQTAVQNIANEQGVGTPSSTWRFIFGMVIGGGLVYLFKRGADYYIGTSYEVVEQKIREFAREHKKMPILSVENLNEVARGVWEGSVTNMTERRICGYPHFAPFKVRYVGGKIKQFDCKAVIDPRDKQYVHDMRMPDVPAPKQPEPQKQETVRITK